MTTTQNWPPSVGGLTGDATRTKRARWLYVGRSVEVRGCADGVVPGMELGVDRPCEGPRRGPRREAYIPLKLEALFRRSRL